MHFIQKNPIKCHPGYFEILYNPLETGSRYVVFFSKGTHVIKCLLAALQPRSFCSANETISDRHPEMSLQSQLIKPCSKALYVIQRGIAPRMSGRGEGESFRAAKRCSCEVTSVFVAGVTALPQPLRPWQPPQAHSPWCCCLRTYYKVM